MRPTPEEIAAEFDRSVVIPANERLREDNVRLETARIELEKLVAEKRMVVQRMRRIVAEIEAEKSDIESAIERVSREAGMPIGATLFP